jgi:hypothetical protein
MRLTETESSPAWTMSHIYASKDETNLVHYTSGSVFPSEMKETIFASSENYGSLDGAGFNCVRVFAAKGSASLECKKNISHVVVRRDARSIQTPTPS